MLRWIRRIVLSTMIVLVVAVLHYTLPDRDVVRIVGTRTQRMDLGENAFFFSAPAVGTAVAADGTRDVMFIDAFRADGRPIVYRNEDTGWVWPPYFKINSFSLQARATDLVSTEANPRWVVVTHYGWRSELLTIFPNAVRLREVPSPDVTLIPWLNMVILALLAAAVFAIVRMLARFHERTLDPLFDAIGDAVDRFSARIGRARARLRTMWGRFAAWRASWRSRPRP
jgi:hypothetical protein